MVKNSELLEVDGEVIEVLWSDYRIKLDGMDMIVTAYMSGKMKKNKIKILPSDRVRVALSEYDPSKWRIIYRMK